MDLVDQRLRGYLGYLQHRNDTDTFNSYSREIREILFNTCSTEINFDLSVTSTCDAILGLNFQFTFDHKSKQRTVQKSTEVKESSLHTVSDQ